MIKPNEIARKVRVRLNAQFKEKCLGDKYLKGEPILYIQEHNVYTDTRGQYVMIKGTHNSGYAYLNELDLVFDVDGDGNPMQPSMTREQADLLLRQFRTQCLPHGEYPDYVLINFLNEKFKERNS